MTDSSVPIINEVSERDSTNNITGGLVAYDSDSDSSSSDSQEPNQPKQQLKSSPSNIPPLPPPTLFSGSRALATFGVNLAPAVPEGPINDPKAMGPVDPYAKNVAYNPKFDDLYSPMAGPINPRRTTQLRAPRNTLSGYVEAADFSDFQFETQRRTYHNFGFALDPSINQTQSGLNFIGDKLKLAEYRGQSILECTVKSALNPPGIKKPAAASSANFKDASSKTSPSTISSPEAISTAAATTSTPAAATTSTPSAATTSTPATAATSTAATATSSSSSAESAEKTSAAPTSAAQDKDTEAKEGEQVDELADEEEEEAEAEEAAIAATPASSAALANAARKKRKRVRNSDASDIEGYQGPWAKFEGEASSIPDPETKKVLDEYLAKRKAKKGISVEGAPVEEKSTLHVESVHDYQGRSYLAAPRDESVNLTDPNPPERCFLPKKLLHSWNVSNKPVNALRLLPITGHLVLTCAADAKIKLYEVYGARRLLRSFMGHQLSVRDACFTNDAKQFLSASYDRCMKLWDTETGQCVSKFSNQKVAYCVKLNPDADKQQLFIAGCNDKKIHCWDMRTGETCQEYDRHLAAINTLTFVDQNRRFVSTSDDKTIRVWEWDIPVDFKYIADPSMHSMPYVALSPNGKWLACQSMDNQIVIYNALHNFKRVGKKAFRGHMVAGYACGLDFSPDMAYVASGDADGKAFVWDWRTTRQVSRWRAHDNVCIAAHWLPHEPSKLLTAGWEGTVKLWD